MSVLFIGLGNMGSGMAMNLVNAGQDVMVFDLSKDAMQKLVDHGASAVDDLPKAITKADTIITMLPAGKHVQHVYLNAKNGIAQFAKANTLLIDCSTIDVATARMVEAATTAKNFRFVDAPVSGGVAAASGGTLTFMVGGAQPSFYAAKVYLNMMGKNIFHAGDAGAGQAAKICNNMLLAITMIGTCEAFNMAEKMGLDAQTFYDISSTASGQSWSMTSYCPAPGPVPNAPSNNEYKAGFAAAMMLKDLRLAGEAATQFGAATPMGGQAKELYTMMEAKGVDDLDFSAVMKLLNGSI